MKKLLLILGFFGLNFDIAIEAVRVQGGTNIPLGHGINIKLSKTEEFSDKVVLGVFAAILMAKIAYDVSWQNTYFNKANDIYSQMLREMNNRGIVTIDQLAALPLFDVVINDEVVIYEAWVRASYGSWLTPWNWSATQKSAYDMMQILAIVVLHGQLLEEGRVLSGTDVIEHVRGKCAAASMYPLVYYGQELDNHIQFIKTESKNIQNVTIRHMLQNIVSGLGNIKYLLRQEKEYINEFQTLQTHELLKQVRNAQN